MPDSPVIGVTLDPTRGGHHHRALWLGIRRYAEEHDWRLALDPYADSRPTEPYDGIITHGEPSYRARRFTAPGVCLAPFEKNNPMSRVVPDYRLAGRLAALHLSEAGYSNLAVFGHNRVRSAWLQMEAFRATARRKGTHLESMVFGRRRGPSPTTWPRFCTILEDWFAKVELPVGILATDDLFARRIADACTRARLRIPDDVGIVGCGNDPFLCEGPAPALTSVDLDGETVGYRAAATLGEVLDGKLEGPVRRKIRPLGVVPRRSTDYPLSESPLVSAALEWIARHCHEPIRVEGVAKGVGAPLWELRKLMREARSHSVVHAIAQARLARAMSVLESTDYRIETVAERAGYSGRHVMTAAFREHLHTTPHAYRQAAASGALPPSSPIEHAKQLLRETPWSIDRIALVTGYGTEIRLITAFRRHFDMTPGVWRSVYGTPAVKKATAEPEPPWPQSVTITFYDKDGNVME